MCAFKKKGPEQFSDPFLADEKTSAFLLSLGFPVVADVFFNRFQHHLSGVNPFLLLFI